MPKVPKRKSHASIQRKPYISYSDLITIIEGRGGKKCAAQNRETDQFSARQIFAHINRLIEELTPHEDLKHRGKIRRF
jgi:hypothetical protein